MTLLEFVPQCCDASIYLQMGKHCAEEGICYNPLRPMGAVYWFSLPYRLGLPPASLIIGHYFLLAVSILLSAVTARRIFRKNFGLQTTHLKLGALLLCSISIHLFFLFPVLHTSLSDTPAGLLALIGTWLLLMSPEGIKTQILTFGMAGLALGLAAWLRAFYLYPVLLGLAFWLFLAPWKDKNSRVYLTILTAIIPIGAQYCATFNASHTISYLEPEISSDWSMVHLDSTITGYDTILPFDYHTWYAPCKIYSSPLRAIQTVDIKSMACVIAGRIQFYLGSYSPHPYLPPFEHELPDVAISDFNPLSTEKSAINQTKKNIALGKLEEIQITDEKNNHQTVQAQKVWKPSSDRTGSLTQRVYLERGNTYYFKLFFWSESDLHSIDIDIINTHDQKIMAHTNVLLVPFKAPMRLNESFTKAQIDQNGFYEIMITSKHPGHTDPLFKAAREYGLMLNNGIFYAWGAQLMKKSYTEPTSRRWSNTILIANILAILMALIAITVFIRQKNMHQASICFIPVLCFALSILIVPEQRFIIFPIIFSWWLGVIMLIKITSIKNKDGAGIS